MRSELYAGLWQGETFTAAITDNDGNVIKIKPDDAEKLTFHVPAGKLNGTTQYVIRGVDPADTFSPTDSNVPLLDLTAPAVNVTHIDLKSDLIVVHKVKLQQLIPMV